MGDGTVALSELFFPAYREALFSKATNLVIGGSKGSGKSKFASLLIIYNMMMHPKMNTLAIRRTYNSCRDSVYSDLLWAIDAFGCNEFWDHTLSPLELTYKPTGQKILIRGLDDPLKIASISVPKGILAWVWFEEAFDIKNYDDVLKIMMSIRGEMPEDDPGLFKRFLFTFNPWNEHHWLKEQFFDQKRDDTLAFITTFRDNRKLGQDDIKRYEDLYITNPRAARVICDGLWGRTEGLIYDNFEAEEFDIQEVMREHPHGKPSFGLDFGYAISYNAFVATYTDLETHDLWIYDEYYERGVSNLEIAKRITEMGYSKEVIWADAAEPKSIFELQQGLLDEVELNDGTKVTRRYSLPNIKPALKGPDSVRQGITNLQSYRIHIHRYRCPGTLRDFENYAYAQDKDGKYLEKPEKDWDHGPDAARYSQAKFFRSGHGKVVEAKGIDNYIPATEEHRSRRVGSTSGGITGVRSKWVASSK